MTASVMRLWTSRQRLGGLKPPKKLMAEEPGREMSEGDFWKRRQKGSNRFW